MKVFFVSSVSNLMALKSKNGNDKIKAHGLHSAVTKPELIMIFVGIHKMYNTKKRQ